MSSSFPPLYLELQIASRRDGAETRRGKLNLPHPPRLRRAFSNVIIPSRRRQVKPPPPPPPPVFLKWGKWAAGGALLWSREDG
jgi:hypothetical protein